MRLGVVALALVAGCRKNEPYDGAFREPVAAAVLSGELGPNADQEPVGFVANGVGGRIVALALKQGRFVTDDATASWLRTNDLPTGGLRLLTSVAPYAPDPYEVSLFAGDAAFAQLVEVPWVVGSEQVGGNTVPVEGYASFYEPDTRLAPTVVVEEVEVKKGYTSTERWTITSDGQVWEVVGSRSGRQPEVAVPGVRFVAEERRIAFTLDSPGVAGDVITIDTWNGLVEHEVGGIPRELLMVDRATADGEPDPVLAMIVEDDAGARSLAWFDPASRRLTGEVALGAGAEPVRMDLGDDGLLYVADAARPAVWEVVPGSIGTVEHVLPWPVSDVSMATVPVAELDGSVRERRTLFVVVGGRELWLYDLDEARVIDVNPWLPGDQGLDLGSVVQGIDAVPGEHLLPEYDAAARRESGRTVAVSLADGGVVFARQDTGCLVQDTLGPRTVSTSGTGGLDYTTNFDGDIPTGPYLESSGASSRHIAVNPCGGVALDDSWDLMYDQTLDAWWVFSERRGLQQELAYEDERYTSDLGEVSFLLRAGLTPSIDGMLISFAIDPGTARANGDNDGDGTRETAFSVPGDPVTFSYEVGPRDGKYYVVEERPYVLGLGQASDTVLRIDPQSGRYDAQWQ